METEMKTLQERVDSLERQVAWLLKLSEKQANGTVQVVELLLDVVGASSGK